MATFSGIRDVTSSLVRLLRSHMLSGAEVSTAPPDVVVQSARARVNLYLFHIDRNAPLSNVPRPSGNPPQRQPLAVDLSYLLTAFPEREDELDAQLAAENALGDAMAVLHEYGPLIDTETVRNPVAGPVGGPILEPGLIAEVERLKITFDPTTVEEVTRIWSALSTVNFRLSVMYRVRVVQIAPREAVRAAPPVARRVLAFSSRRRPEITAAYLAPAPGDPEGETRLRIGEDLEIRTEGLGPGRIYVRLERLGPIGVVPDENGTIVLTLPDAQYPPDFDNPLPRPIPDAQRLQPGVIQVRIEAFLPTDEVSGGLGPGVSATAERRFDSNTCFVQVVPRITAIAPLSGSPATVLQVSGTRLWRAGARSQVILGAVAVEVRSPGATDPWSPPSETVVEVPVLPLAAALPAPPVGGDTYPVALEANNARSRDAGFDFTLLP